MNRPPSFFASVARLACALTMTAVVSIAAPVAPQPGPTPILVEPVEPEAPRPDSWPAPLRVSGRSLLTPDGQEVWLQGVNVGSLETRVTGENVLRSFLVAIEDWKSNVIRLPVKEHYWFGEDPSQTDHGEAYRELVDAAINLAANRGVYVVLDLHRFRAIKDEHLAFWKDAAARYMNHPAVLFDLLNEAHGISWDVWRDGGFVEDRTTPADEDSFLPEEEKAKAKQGFHSPGMQAVVKAIRDLGAKNILVISGLEWSADLSGIVRGYALDDHHGNGIMYSWHIYNWHTRWDERVLAVAQQYPILVGEVGADVKKMPFLPAEVQEDPYTWVPDMLGYIQKHRLNWTAWCFHPRHTPVLLKDWTYAPTPFWGQFAKEALSGRQFELRRTR